MSTDPLADWTLERDVLRSDVRPHRLKSPDDSAVWLEAHEADQFERAKAITAHRVQPQPDKSPAETATTTVGESGGGGAVGLPAHPLTRRQIARIVMDSGIGVVMAVLIADRIVDALAASPTTEAPPADDLPEGVSWVLVADGSVVRGLPDDEWERRLGTGWVTDRNAIASPGITYIVRRRPTPPPPAVERVPWWDAMTQELPIAEWGGQRIKHAKLQNSGMFLSTWGTYNVIRVDAADGTVEVLRQDGAA